MKRLSNTPGRKREASVAATASEKRHCPALADQIPCRSGRTPRISRRRRGAGAGHPGRAARVERQRLRAGRRASRLRGYLELRGTNPRRERRTPRGSRRRPVVPAGNRGLPVSRQLRSVPLARRAPQSARHPPQTLRHRRPRLLQLPRAQRRLMVPCRRPLSRRSPPPPCRSPLRNPGNDARGFLLPAPPKPRLHPNPATREPE